MINWFPLPRNLMENRSFIQQTPVEKLYLFYIASEMNLHGPFYKSDLEIAVTLCVSTDKVRRIRREDMGLGWVKARPGFQSGGRNLATSYLDVPGASRQDSDFFAPFHRYTFEALLHKVREYMLSHADLVTYVYLTYFKARCGCDDDSFFISKKELRELTGIPSAVASVDSLSKYSTYSNGAHLFQYTDEYHRLTFGQWARFTDPSESKNNAANARSYRQDIRQAANDLRASASGRCVEPGSVKRA